MDASRIYIAIAIVVLLIISRRIISGRKSKEELKFTPLAGLALGFVVAGIVFGDSRLLADVVFEDSRLLAYGLMGIGVGLGVIDIIVKLRKE